MELAAAVLSRYTPRMSHGTAVLFTLLSYQIVLLGIGLLCRGRTRSGLDFFLGGRGLGPVVAAISASASSSSAWTLLGVSGAAYAWGLSALWLFPSCVGGFLLNWYVLAPALRTASRRQNALTVSEVLSGPRDRELRQTIATVASAIILVSLGAYVASQFQAAGKTLSQTFGISLPTSILVGAGVVVLYTMLGGFWAVSVTDTLQGLVMAATSVILPVTALIAVGGPSSLVRELATIPQSDYWSMTRGLPLVAATGFVLGLLGIGLGYPGQPHVVNRFMALKGGESVLRRARWIAIVWAVLVYAGMLMVGFCGRVLHPALADPEVVFISLTNSLFPSIIGGVMLAAVLSAIMSTADSQLLVAASSITHDLNPQGGDPRMFLRRSRQVVFALSCCAVIAALFGSQEIFSRVLFAWSAMGSAFGPLLLVNVLKGRVAPRATLLSMVVGFSASVTAYYVFAGNGTMERVLPFLLALAIAYGGREKADSNQVSA